MFVLPCHAARRIALGETPWELMKCAALDGSSERSSCALRAIARVSSGISAATCRVMETRSRAQRTSWLRRTSWKLGSVFAQLAKRFGKSSIPISAVILARTGVSTVNPDQPIEDVAGMFVRDAAAQMPVIDHGRALGVVTRDAVGETLASDGPHALVGNVALADVVIVEPSASLERVIEALDEHPGAVALVIDRGEPVGLVTREQLDEYLAHAA